MKTIPGYSDLYSITLCGKVWSNRRKKFLASALDTKGYPMVVLCDNAKRKTVKVHRLMMLTYKGPSDLQVNHINGIKTDNRINNLEYVTQSDNLKHAYSLGLLCKKGINNPAYKHGRYIGKKHS